MRVAMRRAVIVVGFVATASLAQAPPDAGRILQNNTPQEDQPVPRDGPSITVEPVPGQTAAPSPGPRFRVEHFRITGNSVLTESELLTVLSGLAGREMTLAELKKAAGRITDYYRRKGYLVARAYIPTQDLKEGNAEIAVLEGRVGAVKVRVNGERRVPEQKLRDIAAVHLPEGSVVRDRALESALLLMRDLPGVETRSTLRAGQAPGTADIVVDANGPPLVTGDVDFDTFGEKFTGIERLGGTLNLNNPLQMGDQASLRAIHASGSDYARVRYQLPLGASGLNVGAAYSKVTYHLCCNFAPLHASGSAIVNSIYAKYPLVRSMGFNLSAILSHESKDFNNRTIVGLVSDYHSNVTTVSVYGDQRDKVAGGGITIFSLALGSGNLDLDPLPTNKAADAAGPNARGSFSKINVDLSRRQALSGPLSLFVSVNGQLASKNLDSYEQMVLGGAYGIRAYPQGEAPGDEGLIANVELRWDAVQDVQLSAFFDQGMIRQHKNPWLNWQGGNHKLPNNYSLAGAGFGLNWISRQQYMVKVSIASPMGSNPGRDVSGKNSDGAHQENRFWLQLAKYF